MGTCSHVVLGNVPPRILWGETMRWNPWYIFSAFLCFHIYNSMILSGSRFIEPTTIDDVVLSYACSCFACVNSINQRAMLCSIDIPWIRLYGNIWGGGGDPPATSGLPSQRPVTWSFDVFFDLRLSKQLSKQLRRRWFETTSRTLWSHANVLQVKMWTDAKITGATGTRHGNL